MKFTAGSACVAALLIISGCARTQVSCEIESAYDFGGIRTYQWIEASRDILEQENIYLNRDLQQALNNELSARGWRQVPEAGGATVQITYYMQITEHQEYVESASRSESEFAGGLVFQTGDWSYEERGPDQLVYTVETGALNVTVTDTAGGRRVWRGSLQIRLDRSAPIEKQHEVFRMAARKLLEQLPEGSK